MMTQCEIENIYSVNESAAEFGAGPDIVAAPCGGMAAIVGSIGYTGGAPATLPTIEFSDDGLNWDSTQLATLDATAAAGVTLYSFNIAVRAWRFVRVRIFAPITRIRGFVELRPRPQT